MTSEQSADEHDAIGRFAERERATPARTNRDRRRGGFLQKSDRRPTLQLAASFLTTIVAVVAAIAGFSQSTAEFLCATVQRTQGAHVAHGSAIVIVTGLFVLFVGIITRNRPRLFAAVLLVEVAALTSGLVFVARDAAQTKVVEDCGFFTESTSTRAGHVPYLYVVWSAAALILLWQASRGMRRTLSPRFAGSALAALAVGVGLGLFPDGQHHRGSGAAAASLPPKGVLICRDAFKPPSLRWLAMPKQHRHRHRAAATRADLCAVLRRSPREDRRSGLGPGVLLEDAAQTRQLQEHRGQP